jgi:hypothetical protein
LCAKMFRVNKALTKPRFQVVHYFEVPRFE